LLTLGVVGLFVLVEEAFLESRRVGEEIAPTGLRRRFEPT
jgi:hypothetical protein